MNYYRLNESPMSFILKLNELTKDNDLIVDKIASMFCYELASEWFLNTYEVGIEYNNLNYKDYLSRIPVFMNDRNKAIKKSWALKKEFSSPHQLLRSVIDLNYDNFLPKFAFFKKDEEYFVYIKSSSEFLVDWLEEYVFENLELSNIALSVYEEYSFVLDLNIKYRSNLKEMKVKDLLNLNESSFFRDNIEDVVEVELMNERDSELMEEAKTNKSAYRKKRKSLIEDSLFSSELKSRTQNEYDRVIESQKELLVFDWMLNSFKYEEENG